MNKQILKLAEQAGFVLWQTEQWRGDNIIDWSCNYDRELEQFAKLLVQECSKVVEPSSYRRAFPDNYEGGIGALEALEYAAAKLKQHFED